jgi:hypothetical protein
VTGSTGTNTITLTAGGKTVGSGTGSGSGPYSIPWDTTAVPDGTQTLTAAVRDGSGKTGSVNVSVNVKNNTTPTGTLQVAVTQPTGGSTVGGTVWVVMWVTGASGSANQFTLSVDGVAVGTSTVPNAGPVTIPWVTSTNGSHTITATVKDATGNTGSTNVTVTVAN